MPPPRTTPRARRFLAQQLADAARGRCIEKTCNAEHRRAPEKRTGRMRRMQLKACKMRRAVAERLL